MLVRINKSLHILRIPIQMHGRCVLTWCSPWEHTRKHHLNGRLSALGWKEDWPSPWSMTHSKLVCFPRCRPEYTRIGKKLQHKHRDETKTCGKSRLMAEYHLLICCMSASKRSSAASLLLPRTGSTSLYWTEVSFKTAILMCKYGGAFTWCACALGWWLRAASRYFQYWQVPWWHLLAASLCLWSTCNA